MTSEMPDSIGIDTNLGIEKVLGAFIIAERKHGKWGHWTVLFHAGCEEWGIKCPYCKPDH